MVIDLDKCIGCQTCAVICKMHHAQPQGTWWNRVFTQGSDYHQSAADVEVTARCFQAIVQRGIVSV